MKIEKRKRKIKKEIKRLKELFPNISFDFKITFHRLNNKTIAFFSPSRNEISFNERYFDACKFSIYKEVVRHEVGHFIARRIHGREIQTHGKEWRQVMYKLGSENPRATTTLSKDSIKYGEEVFCRCGSIRISKNKFTRMNNGAIYYCNNCNSMLKQYRSLIY